MSSNAQPNQTAKLITAVILFFCPVLANAWDVGEDRLNKVDEEIRSEVDSGRLPGAVTLTAQNGKILRIRASGYRDMENQQPMTEDTFFRLYSMSKPVTGIGLMMLFEQGKFALSDPVAKYIPQFADLKVLNVSDNGVMRELEPAAHPITMHELITHTAGFVYIPPYSRGAVADLYADQDMLAVDSSLTAMVEKLSRTPLSYQPGTRQAYSLSVDIQGYIIEVLSGMQLDAYLHEKLFKPLRMSNTGFFVPPDQKDLLTRRYRRTDGRGWYSDPNHRFTYKPGLLSGGNGLVSTIEDYYRFLQMLLNGGELEGVRVIQEETLKVLQTINLPPTVKERYQPYPNNEFKGHFSYVLAERSNDGLPAGSYWWWGLVGTWFWVDPVNNVIFVGMAQIEDFPYTRRLVRMSRRAVYGK